MTGLAEYSIPAPASRLARFPETPEQFPSPQGVVATFHSSGCRSFQIDLQLHELANARNRDSIYWKHSLYTYENNPGKRDRAAEIQNHRENRKGLLIPRRAQKEGANRRWKQNPDARRTISSQTLWRDPQKAFGGLFCISLLRLQAFSFSVFCLSIAYLLIINAKPSWFSY